MAWGVRDMHEQRVRFVVRAQSGAESLSALCREFAISRPTGYAWLRRYQETGSLAGVVERSRRPHRTPTRTPPAIEARVVALRPPRDLLHVRQRLRRSIAVEPLVSGFAATPKRATQGAH